ncbi:hypothetical protein [Roseicella aquatilis]|uniref:Uncharacterized protein n=1 Tax=Roseicella aquatilis TaxID=2527868 RepID=A0A4R4D217_9PROT|nr:hypothetical protein [Roseicella aquatilis]TCZ51790.1 hypothetical protein EXY23_26705 [Roseicella aquatilis]
MNSGFSNRAGLPQLSPRWTTPDAAAAQSDRNAGLQAAREGADGPAALARFRRRLADEGAGDLDRLHAECRQLLDRQEREREARRHDLDTTLVERGRANQHRHDERAAALKRENGPESGPYKDRAGRAEAAQAALRSVRAAVGFRPLRTHFGLLYPVMMTALALAEVPVNRAAFELTFREEPLVSLLLAAAVGGLLMAFAHVVGMLLRRWPERPRLAQVASRGGALAVILAIVGGGIYALARMRQVFMHLTSTEGEGFAQRLQDALAGTPREAVTAIADLPLGVGDYAFIAVNLLIFTFGVVASFLRHDPHPDYEKAVREARRTERTFARIERRHAEAMREETARFEAERRAIEGEMGAVRAQLAALGSQARAVQEHAEAARLAVARTVRRRCDTFAEGVQAGRPGGELLAVPGVEAIAAELPSFRAPAHVA